MGVKGKRTVRMKSNKRSKMVRYRRLKKGKINNRRGMRREWCMGCHHSYPTCDQPSMSYNDTLQYDYCTRDISRGCRPREIFLTKESFLAISLDSCQLHWLASPPASDLFDTCLTIIQDKYVSPSRAGPLLCTTIEGSCAFSM